MAQTSNIKKIRQRRDINIGMIILLFIAIYFVVNIFRYFTKTHISLYEVAPGSIYRQDTRNGIILRDEIVYYTDTAGYVNFYFREGARVSKGSTVYSIDSDRKIYDYLTGSKDEIKLSTKDLLSIKDLVVSDISGIDSFSMVSTVKSDIKSGYQRLLDKELMDQLNSIVTTNGLTSDFHVVSSDKSGLISYVYDDYVGLKVEDISTELFLNAPIMSSLFSLDLVGADSPIYKIVSGDEWQIAVSLDKATFEANKEKKEMVFSLGKSTYKFKQPVTFFQKEGGYFMLINMNRCISDFLSDRYIAVNISLDAIEGLKIPETAVLQKNYYRIPSSYFISGGNSQKPNTGLLFKETDPVTGESAYNFKEVNVFVSIDGFNYVDCRDFDENSYISLPDLSTDNMLVTFITKLEGAFNINKGYAVFKRIERITTENGYIIIKNNTSSGLSAYDHIALDASAVTEDEVIYR